MAVEQGKLKTPEENYEDAALELALYRMLRHEHEMVKANSSEDDEKETQRIAAESTPRIFALIERRTKRREGNSFKRQSARFLKAVACVVLVANMGLTIATATSAPVRAKVMDFLTEINASYMSMGFREPNWKSTCQKTGREAIIRPSCRKAICYSSQNRIKGKTRLSIQMYRVKLCASQNAISQ